MLALMCAGFVAPTLNWFDVAAAFPLIGAEFHTGLGSLSFLISLFIVGYGLAHVPGGMPATAIGMKRTLVIGLALQGFAGVMSGLSYSYADLPAASHQLARGMSYAGRSGSSAVGLRSGRAFLQAVNVGSVRARRAPE